MTMATQSADTSDFITNLGRIYGIYTGSFLGFIILLAILEQIGVPNKILGYLFVFLTIGVYAVIGIISRTAQVSEYYVAGRRVPAFYNGMATGADWMSAASFIGMAGTLFLLGYDGLAFVLGWTGGYVLVSILIGPYLRKFGDYTVPDFLSPVTAATSRASSAVIVLMCCSFTYVMAQIYRHRHHHLALPRHALRGRGVRRPRRHPGLLDAGRHARGHLDPGRPVHRADHRLPDADRDPVDQDVPAFRSRS